MKYQYDQKTGELLAEVDVDYDAAFLTDKKPPTTKKNEAVVFFDENGDVPRRATNGAWKVVPDFRGVKYWLDHETSHVISALNKTIPNDAFLEQPAKTLQVLAGEALDALEHAVNDYHDKVAGTANERRQKRFQLNHVAAERILKGTASNKLRDAMTQMLDSNKKRKPDVYAHLNLESFCQWIIEQYEKSLIGSIYTETTYINTLQGVEQAKDATGLEQRLVQASKEAEDQLSALQQL